MEKDCEELPENPPDSKSQVTPSTGSNEMRKQCEPNINGKCVVHECVMSKQKISTKKWKDRSNGRG